MTLSLGIIVGKDGTADNPTIAALQPDELIIVSQGPDIEGAIRSDKEFVEEDIPAVLEAATSDWVLVLRHDEQLPLDRARLNVFLDTMLTRWALPIQHVTTYKGSVVSKHVENGQVRLVRRTAVAPHKGGLNEPLRTSGFGNLLPIPLVHTFELDALIDELTRRQAANPEKPAAGDAAIARLRELKEQCDAATA